VLYRIRPRSGVEVGCDGFIEDTNQEGGVDKMVTIDRDKGITTIRTSDRIDRCYIRSRHISKRNEGSLIGIGSGTGDQTGREGRGIHIVDTVIEGEREIHVQGGL
jgi:hypothetical protein